MDLPENIEKLDRIDKNVADLLRHFDPLHAKVQRLDKDSAVNKREHKFVFSVLGIVGSAGVMWLCKKLGIPVVS